MTDDAPPPRPPQPPPPEPSVPPVSAPPTVEYPSQYPGQYPGQYPVQYPPVSGSPATVPVPYPPPAAYSPAAAYAPPYAAQPPMGAPFGVDPITGLPLSDKSKVVAGILQLVLGFLFTLGGVGRLYAGNTGLGVAQIVATVVAWTSFWCGFFLVVPWFLWGAIWLWFVIDGIVMLAGRSLDGQGRVLRS